MSPPLPPNPQQALGGTVALPTTPKVSEPPSRPLPQALSSASPALEHPLSACHVPWQCSGAGVLQSPGAFQSGFPRASPGLPVPHQQSLRSHSLAGAWT